MLFPGSLSIQHMAVCSAYGVMFDIVYKIPGAGALKRGITVLI